ncbi:MAG: hypothetical protein AB7T31_06650 [Gemmatimonadales bacterium]
MKLGTPRTSSRSKRAAATAVAAGLVALAACGEEVATGPDDSQLPVEPVTVSLQLDWDEFASNLQVFGGYGRVDDMSSTVIARAYDGVEARTLVRFGSIPRSALVRDSTNTLRTDSALTFVDAYVVVLVDQAASTNGGVVQLGFGQTLERWDAATANWTNAVDTLGGAVPWSQPGGGAVTPLATWDYDPALGDSAQFFLDSATISQWREGSDSVRAGRIDLLTDGHRLQLVAAALRVVANSLLDPDTVIVFDVGVTQETFIYDPSPPPPPADGLRVGGSPAWRTVFDVAVPSTLNGPPELCAAVGCPFTLGPQHVTYAGLGVHTRRSPDAFQPTDTVAVEVRPVLDKATLPKAPLGSALGATGGTPISPGLLGVEGSLVDLPITRYVQGFLSGPDPSGRQPPTTLAILATPEPNSFSFASFFGPGATNAPVLNLVLTVSPPMEIR